jgi:Spy/CpxP family protein refolding chaperone
LFDQLNLTPDQQQQIQTIRTTITDRQERREAMMKVLTPDQQAKLQQLRAQFGGQHGGGPGGGGPGGGNGGTPGGGGWQNTSSH